MKKNIEALANREFDLIIIGGGIFGLCSAWDAASRGLSVAIIEKNDFAHAASSNHFKMVHGGIRYLQHGDIMRIRESSRERSALLRIAPHLVRPLPIVIPTYGYGIKGKPFIGAGSFVYDLITFDRNAKVNPDRRIPLSKCISKKQILGLFPDLEKSNLTGGVIFCDGQVYNPPRLGISFLRSAVQEGAEAANYVEATGFLKKDKKVIGVHALDKIGKTQFEIRGKWVLNTTGAWAQPLLKSELNIQLNPLPTFSRDLAFVIDRKVDHDYALAFSTKTRDADSIIDIGGRRLFAVPWRGYTLVGVWHKIHSDIPESINVSEDEMAAIINEVNDAYGGLNIEIDDVRMVNMGLTLFGGQDKQGKNNLSFGKRSRLIDHKKEHGVTGLTTLIGVRATTARRMAQKAINLVSTNLGKKYAQCVTEFKPVFGGEISCFKDFLRQQAETCPHGIDEKTLDSLIRNYGTEFKGVLKYIDENSSLKATLGKSRTLAAEVVHAIREEMVEHLSDLIFRRTDLSSGGYFDETVISRVAQLAAKEMHWDETKTQAELREVKQAFPQFSILRP